jgi:hypothetical protein
MKRRTVLFLVAAGSACAVAAGSLQAQALAKLAHRFTFEGNAVDVVGEMTGVKMTGNEGFLEPPLFEAVVPPGATGPAKSMRVGMQHGKKKSGIMLPAQVIEAIQDAGSLAFFVKPEGPHEQPQVLLNSGPLEGGGLMLRASTAGPVEVRIGGPDHPTPLAHFDAPPGRWTHVALVWNKTPQGLQVAFSANGDPVAKQVLPQGKLSGHPFSVGGLSHNNVENALRVQYQGHFYDLQIYKGVLSPSEIAGLAAKPGTTR